MFIYIAGPLSASTKEEEHKNVQRAIAIGIQLMRKGHRVMIPHLTQYIADHPDCDLPRTRAFWVRWFDFGWMDKCDAVFFMEGWRESEGAILEYLYALQGMLRYYGLEEVPDRSHKPEFKEAMGDAEREATN